MQAKRFLGLMLVLVFLVGCTPENIWVASRNGHLDQVKKLLDQNPKLLEAKHMEAIEGDENNKWTPLHYAVWNNHDRLVKMLLARGADPLGKARGGWTPLHAAREQGQIKIEKMLIKAIKASGRPMP